MSGSGISWAVCKSAPHSRQITTPAPHHLVFYRVDALPAAQPTVSKHWRDNDAAMEYMILYKTMHVEHAKDSKCSNMHNVHKQMAMGHGVQHMHGLHIPRRMA